MCRNSSLGFHPYTQRLHATSRFYHKSVVIFGIEYSLVSKRLIIVSKQPNSISAKSFQNISRALFSSFAWVSTFWSSINSSPGSDEEGPALRPCRCSIRLRQGPERLWAEKYRKLETVIAFRYSVKRSLVDCVDEENKQIETSGNNEKIRLCKLSPSANKTDKFCRDVTIYTGVQINQQLL